jgi:hypothetical protein
MGNRKFNLNPPVASILIFMWVLFLGYLLYKYIESPFIGLVFPVGGAVIAGICVLCFKGGEDHD